MKAVIISGPESSGKSTLTMELANYYSVEGVPEYARDYVVRLNRPYNCVDVETIARRQVAFYKIMRRQKNMDDLVFFDTFLVVSKVWFQEVFKLCPVWLHNAILENIPDLVLLCKPDITWTDDGVRENPQNRQYLFNCYENEFNYYGINYHLVDGIGSSRLKNAISAINNSGLKTL